ncbi:tetratricopeptide repeat protein [Streptomyces sp. MNU76]|uniref:tetratricopeptide repeat protein n=1 Tax=Streptomyces sp. MNU76 TaxID=2560026 RepID=UPI001E597C4D|nr:tetratricopeptide repeat protein [Streptomyces sp. MNU76]MCC9709044.1 tetratricopeptide repeat protein [Streptomyces sp. MNU76]
MKREPRTMPLTAAKEKQGAQGDASQQASGGVVPSTFVLRAVPEPTEGPLAQPPRTPNLPLTLPGVPVAPDARTSAPEPAQDPAPAVGTVSPPTGEFGPLTAPASLDPQPWPAAPADVPTRAGAPARPGIDAPARPGVAHIPSSGPARSPGPSRWSPSPGPHSDSGPDAAPDAAPTTPTPELAPLSTPAPVEESASDAYSAPEWKVLEEDDAPKPAPVREFDAVAEAVLDPEEDGGTPSPFAEAVSRINEAVKLGRIQEAAEMAEQTVAQATVALGPQHPEVLKLRELTAYIAYLAGDALRSFHLSLDLAGLRHRMRDQRAAYGNIQSAAAAWRAVRDPLQGLHLGRDLIAVWTDLAADAGPAADDLEQLEKARTRMTRLTDRARALDSAPYAHGQ